MKTLLKKAVFAFTATTAMTTAAVAAQPAATGQPPATSQPAATAQPARAPAAPAQAPAAARPDADPAMWVVRDDDTTIYLFGTFHLMDGRADWFNEEVRAAFDRSQELVMEIDMPDDPAAVAAQFQPLVARYAVDPQGRSLRTLLSADEYRKLYDGLSPLGVPAGAFDRMEPWFAFMMLAGAQAQKFGLTPEHGAEHVLKAATSGRNMTRGAVETLEGQIQMFDTMPHDVQLTMLKESLGDLDAMAEMMPRMIAAWNSGDAEAIDRLMNEGLGENPALRRIMLGDRNQKWAEWIDQRLDRPGTVFMAVGAGHLVGPDSVQAFLRQRNIASSRVPAN